VLRCAHFLFRASVSLAADFNGNVTDLNIGVSGSFSLFRTAEAREGAHPAKL